MARLSMVRNSPRGHCAGFTFIELLIAAQIIGIIAAVAIPSLLRGRVSSNESATIGDVRTVISAEATYQGANEGLYATATELFEHGLIDARLAAALGVPLGTKSPDGRLVDLAGAGGSAGFIPGVSVENDRPDPTVTVSAWPGRIHGTGSRAFFVDPSNVIRVICLPPKKLNPETGECEGNDEYIAAAAIGALLPLDSLSHHTVLMMAVESPPSAEMIAQVLALLDANADGTLSVREVLKADILRMARSLTGGGRAEDDNEVDHILKRFGADLERQLALGTANEGEATVSPSEMSGDVPRLLELALLYASECSR